MKAPRDGSTDAELASRAASGDREAFRALAESWWERIGAYAAAMPPSPSA